MKQNRIEPDRSRGVCVCRRNRLGLEEWEAPRWPKMPPWAACPGWLVWRGDLLTQGVVLKGVCRDASTFLVAGLHTRVPGRARAGPRPPEHYGARWVGGLGVDLDPPMTVTPHVRAGLRVSLACA